MVTQSRPETLLGCATIRCLVDALLTVDFENGKLFWKPRARSMFSTQRASNSWNTRFDGKEAFIALDGNGYLCGAIFGRKYKAHRVIWLMHTGEWPEDQIGHVNGIRTDNRLANLRSVSRSENMKNQRRPSHNTSGALGVFWDKQHRKWRAKIKIAGRSEHIGLFANFHDAVAARKTADIKHGFHENHGR